MKMKENERKWKWNNEMKYNEENEKEKENNERKYKMKNNEIIIMKNEIRKWK